MSAPESSPASYPSGYPKLFWAALVVGVAVMAVGVRGLLVNSDAAMETNPPAWVVLFAAGNVVHDLVLVPLVLVVGLGLSRLVPKGIRPVVQGGLICSGVVVLFALPFVLRLGENPSNESILPRDYGRGLLIVLAVVWAVTSSVALASRLRSRAVRPPNSATHDQRSHHG